MVGSFVNLFYHFAHRSHHLTEVGNRATMFNRRDVRVEGEFLARPSVIIAESFSPHSQLFCISACSASLHAIFSSTFPSLTSCPKLDFEAGVTTGSLKFLRPQPFGEKFIAGVGSIICTTIRQQAKIKLLK